MASVVRNYILGFNLTLGIYMVRGGRLSKNPHFVIRAL